ncbi:MAG: peptidoglycan-binding protein [Xanthobacteraceae bacterium]|nr:peptidoglycan-binding protein [Xanthobacteraceae bacterium]
MKRQLLVSTATAAILSGLVFASAQEMPRGGGKQEGTIQNQGAQGGAQRGEGRQQMPQRQNETQGPEGQRSQSQPEKGKAKQQAQPKPDMNRDRQQTTGQGQRDQGNAKQQAQPKPDRDRERQQTTGQGQRDQGKAKQQAQPKPDRNRDQLHTTGQGQRDQDKAKQAQPKTERDQTVGQGRQQQDPQQSGDRASTQTNTQLSVEQRTRIRQTITARSDVPRVDSVNFRVSVGTVVPPRVRVAVVPREIVEIYPRFRSYQYVVVRDEIVIIDNRRRIVEVIPVESAGGSGPAIRGSRTDVVIDLSRDEIIAVQRVLVQRGFSVEVDGRLGPRTRQALMQFQRQEGLQVTGRVDSRTVTSLGVSVRSVQGGDGQQPSTTGQGGASKGGSGQGSSGQGSGASEQPSQPSQGAGQPQRSPSGQQGDRSGAPQQGNQSGGGQQGAQQQGNPSQSPSPTTGQGGGSNQNAPANQGLGAGQGGASNPAAKQAPSSGGGSMPNNQQQK